MAATQLIQIRDTDNATEWVDDLFNGAIGAGVSDVQLRLEREEQRLTVRARVNRVMEDIAVAQGRLAIEVTNRIKSGAQIPTGPASSIADGLYEHELATIKHDLRVALFPSRGGETMALRFPADQSMPVIEDIGFSEKNTAQLTRLLGLANGLILMAGPMGAGKTTTMYAIVGALGGPRKNVFTVEDPVERVVPGATQIQINVRSQNGWPEVLRGLRRSDLEVLMIGEIRDGEQANAALEIGNAGAKVVSSIHANDSVGAVHQILELSESAPRMLGNQLRGVISQRLLRRIHRDCAGAGCDGCASSGYKGVAPIHEVLVVDDSLIEGLIKDVSKSELQQIAQDGGMQTLWESALELIGEGVTDLKEAERVLGAASTDVQEAAAAISAQPVTQEEETHVERRDSDNSDRAAVAGTRRAQRATAPAGVGAEPAPAPAGAPLPLPLPTAL